MKVAEANRRVVELEAELAKLKAAIGGRFYSRRHLSDKFIALPLTEDERRAVADYASDRVCDLIGEGELVDGSGDLDDAEAYSTHDYLVEWRWEELLPAFQGLMVRATYNREAGSNVVGIWGLRKV